METALSPEPSPLVNNSVSFTACVTLQENSIGVAIPVRTEAERLQAIPYVGTILGGLEPGNMVVIYGTVLADAEGFAFNFQCGSSEKPRSDIAFHFNPRFKGSGEIVCNTLKNEKWGKEEKSYHVPFIKGQPFEITFLVFHHKFQVSSNGRYLVSYKHRINLDRVDTLGIHGKVKIASVSFASYMSPQRSQPSLAVSNSNLVVPYQSSLSMSFIPGKTLLVKGEIKENAKSFSIDLKVGGTTNIALHLNPRMKEKVFVRNTYLNDSWGGEEKQLWEFPFFPEMFFELLVYCEAHQFKVAVNGQHMLEYKHRFKDLNKINEIAVGGDLMLYDVKVW
ncbi:galectin-8 [Gastrophryne carolinensis]